jgi:hypothetical protein
VLFLFRIGNCFIVACTLCQENYIYYYHVRPAN